MPKSCQSASPPLVDVNNNDWIVDISERIGVAAPAMQIYVRQATTKHNPISSMNVNNVSEQSLARVWIALAKYRRGDYLPSASEVGKTAFLSGALVGAAYRALHSRGYLVKRGKYFVKIVEGVFVAGQLGFGPRVHPAQSKSGWSLSRVMMQNLFTWHGNKISTRSAIGAMTR